MAGVQNHSPLVVRSENCQLYSSVTLCTMWNCSSAVFDISTPRDWSPCCSGPYDSWSQGLSSSCLLVTHHCIDHWVWGPDSCNRCRASSLAVHGAHRCSVLWYTIEFNHYLAPGQVQYFFTCHAVIRHTSVSAVMTSFAKTW